MIRVIRRSVSVPQKNWRQRRARVVEEVDAVDVEDVDRARAVVRDAVLVLAPQAERRADLGAGGVAAALAAGDHDDPAAHVIALMPDAARADDARVVVRMGPLAHHVDLHGLVGRVGAAVAPGTAVRNPRERSKDHAETFHVAPLHTRTPSHDFEHASPYVIPGFRRLSSRAATLVRVRPRRRRCPARGCSSCPRAPTPRRCSTSSSTRARSGTAPRTPSRARCWTAPRRSRARTSCSRDAGIPTRAPTA